MKWIHAHHAKRIVGVITTLCWCITSNACVLDEIGSACEIVCPSEYDYGSEQAHEHAHYHESEHAHVDDFAHTRDYDSEPGHDHESKNESEETELCCKDFGSIVRLQDSSKIEYRLTHAVSHFLAWLVFSLPDSIKPRKEFQDTGPPQVVSSVEISLMCCLLSNAPPCLI